MADWHDSSVTGPSSGESGDPFPIPFNSRRSPILCTNGCVASSQPLASSAGISILMKGGNAADAALATAAVLAITEPCSTGLGGDMFSLYYDSRDKEVKCVNGSGRCPGNLNLDVLKKELPDGKGGVDNNRHRKSVHSITIPGAARGWEEFYARHSSGIFTFAELLEPAAKLAEDGFPVAPITAVAWSNGVEQDIKRWHTHTSDSHDNVHVPLSIDGRGPLPGEIFKNADMANVLRSLGEHGATKGFYEAFPGQAIVDAVQKHGGYMTADDLTEEYTQCTFPDTISVEYKGLRVHQIPPNGQGIAGLIALSGLNALEGSGMIPTPVSHPQGSGWKSPMIWHAMIEMMRLGFADARAFVCDQEFCESQGRRTNDNDKSSRSSSEYLLDQERISVRAKKVFDSEKASVQGIPDPTSCTVSFQVVDMEGNAVSFVNSNFMGFGTGLVPDGCGFTLQNRGAGFSLDENHPNVIESYKRPYHTIIPAMITHADTDELYATLSNMGGFMQPQGHMQLTVALASGLDPQAAIDQPRFCISDGTHNGTVLIEEGVDDLTIMALLEMGHNMVPNVKGFSRAIFGKAQIIKRERKTGVLWAGSDGRSDGCAVGF
jgi:gamma-glutamyltranspeptidase/glutathione hydrolase